MALAWALVAVVAQAAPTFPALSGRVVDEAGLLSAGTEAALTSELAALEQQTGAQLVVVTLPDLQGYPIEEFGYQLGRHWGIGREAEDDGVLLIVAEAERRVRIEVGYGLEGVLTDAWCGLTIRRQMVPAFRQGDFDRGVRQGASAIIDQLGADPAVQAARVREAAQPEAEEIEPIVVVILVLLFLLLLYLAATGRLGRGGFVVGPTHGGGGGWSGGGGGGFSGGGGSFGGGGASGGW